MGAATALAGCAGTRPEPQGRVVVTTVKGSSDDLRVLRPALDTAVPTVNGEIRLPRDLFVRVLDEREAEELGVSGPTYEPRDRTVYFPASFVEQSRRQLPDEAHLRDALVFVLYHELTHGLIDLLDVPVVGGEERAADGLAAIFGIRSREGGRQVPLGMAKLLESRGAPSRARAGPYAADDYADDHELDPQRAVDALCLVYGSDPGKNAALVGKQLPQARAKNCPFEYREELDAWRRLLTPWLTERGGLRPRVPGGGPLPSRKG